MSLVTSLDVAAPTVQPGRIYGSDAILNLPDPMFFSGNVEIARFGQPTETLATSSFPFVKQNRFDHAGQTVADYRGVGLAELALAVRGLAKHRTAPDFVVHTVEVMEAVTRSAREERAVVLQTTCQRPRPLDAVEDAELIAKMPSPFDEAAMDLQGEARFTAERDAAH